MDFRSKFIRAIGVTLSASCIASNFAYANPKFSRENVSKSFGIFLNQRDKLGLNKNKSCLKVEGIKKAMELNSTVLDDIVNLANFAYYAQVLEFASGSKNCNDDTKKEAEKLRNAIIALETEINKVNTRKLCENVRYNSKDLDGLQKHVDNLIGIVNGLDPEAWEDVCYPTLFELDPFLENLLYTLDDIIKSGKGEVVFGSNSVLQKQIESANLAKKDEESAKAAEYAVLNLFRLMGYHTTEDTKTISNSEAGYDVLIREPSNSSIIGSFSISQHEYEEANKSHRGKCNKCGHIDYYAPGGRDKICEARRDAIDIGNAIHRVFNLMLSKLYNDYLHFCQCFYGEGKNVSTEHRLIPFLSAEKKEGQLPSERYKSIGINFYTEK